MAATTEDLAALVVSISADLTKYTKEMEKVAGVTAKAMKAAEQKVIASNDNMANAAVRSAQKMQRSIGAVNAETANMAAQFQDIAVQLQGGGSPITVALQQGQQLATVFQQIRQQGGSVFQGLGAAFGAFLNPITAATVAIIAIGGYLVKSFGLGKDSIEDTIKELKEFQDLAQATGASALTVRIQAELDEAQIRQIVEKFQARIDAELNRIGAGPGWGEWAKNAFNAVQDVLATRVFDAKPLDNVATAIQALFDTVAADAPGAADKAKEFNDAYKDLTDSLKEGQEDPVKAADALERLASIDLSFFDRADASKFLESFGAAVPAIQEAIKRIQELKQGQLEAAKATDSARKKTKDYADALAELQKFGINKHLTDVEQLWQAWVKADAAATTYAEKQKANTDFAIGQQNLINQAISEGNKDTADFIKKWEGFTPTAKWDVNHFRVGFGSDKFIDQMGKVQEVTQSTVVTMDQALADLQRRIPEFQGIVQRSLGAEFWNKLNEDQKTALTSLVYNYGHVPKAVVEAVRQGGGADAIAQAISGLNKIPGTVNFERRQSEAALFGGDAFKRTQGLQQEVQATQALIAVTQEEIAISNNLSLSYAEQQASIARLRKEKELEAQFTKDNAPLSAQQIDLIKQAGQAAYDAAFAIATNTEAKRNNKVWTEAMSSAEKDAVKSAEDLAKQQQQNAQMFAQLGSSFIQTFVSGLRQGKSAADSMREALIQLADQILSMLLNKALMSLGEGLFGKGGPLAALGLSQGGRPGRGATYRTGLSPFAFVGAPRMASGGFVGVRPGEYPTILHRGEVVIPASAVRRAGIGPFPSGSGGGGTSIRVGNISVETNVDGSGDVRADTERGKQLGQSVRAIVQAEIQKQSRPGGILTAQGSANRVGR